MSPPLPAPSYVALRNALQADFAAGIATPQALLVQWENLPFSVPENKLWCAWNVLTGPEVEASRGHPFNMWRISGGLVKVKLYAPVGQGIGAVSALADLIANHYRGSYKSDCQFWGVELRSGPEGGSRESDTWQVVIDATFTADRLA